MAENWQPAEKVQVNETGDKRAMIGGAWVPVSQAQKNSAGEYRVIPLGAGAPIEQSPPSDPTLMQKVQSSAPMRVIQGMRESIDAGAQGLAHMVPEGVTAAIDTPFAAMRNSDSPLIQTIGETFFADPRAGATDKRMEDTEAQYEQARKATGQEGFDAYRFGGMVLSPTNAAIAAKIPAAALSTIPRMIGTGVGLGALGGGLTGVTDPKDQENYGTAKAFQVGTGMATGAILTPVVSKVLQAAAPLVSRAWDRITGKGAERALKASLETDNVLRAALEDLGQTIDDIPKAQYAALRDQVNTALKAGKKLDAAALMRSKDFEAAGMKGTLGQITRDPMQWAREQNLRGVAGAGEPLTARFSGQDQALQRQLASYGQGASERVTAGEKLVKALSETDESLRKGVSASYKVARGEAGKDLDVPMQGLAQDAADISKRYGKAFPSGIKNMLDDFGIFTGKQTRVFTPEDAEAIIQQASRLRGADKATNSALGEVVSAVKKALTGADVAGGPFAAPRALAKARFDLQDAIPALKAASEGSVAPDAFVRKFVLNGNASEVKGLARVLQQTRPEAYQEARAQIGAQIQRAAFGENLAGDKTLAAERLAKALRDIGTEKLSAFYEPVEIEAMKRAARLAAYIHSVPSAAAPNTSGTGAAIANLGINNLAGASKTLALGKALVRPVLNTRSVNAAMAAKVPQTSAEASPEMIRRAQLAAALSGIVGGGAVAPR